MGKQNKAISTLTDEQFLKEFMRRFNCDGAAFIYLDSGSEFAFGKWNNGTGRNWVKNVFNAVRRDVYLEQDNSRTKATTPVNLAEKF